MKARGIYYHAGCPVCLAAEHGMLPALDANRFDIEMVDLGKEKARIAEAESKGVKSVPALVLGEQVFHINFGADLAALK